MRDYAEEFENRVRFIREILSKSGAEGIVFGNSGGKDSALVGILCKAACDNTVGVILPCSTIRGSCEIDSGRTVQYCSAAANDCALRDCSIREQVGGWNRQP